MRIGFTGTQKGMTARQKQALADELANVAGLQEFHHGDCIGADKDAHDIAVGQCLIVVHPPIIRAKRAFCRARPGTRDKVIICAPADYLVRNRHIVNQTDSVLATPNGKEEVRSGTWSTIRYAVNSGRPVRIIYPNGRIEDR